VSRARSFLVYQTDMPASFAARLLAVPVWHGGASPSGAGTRSSRLARPRCYATPYQACHPKIL